MLVSGMEKIDHGYFITNDNVLYTNTMTKTSVVRDKIYPPTTGKAEFAYGSREAMLEDELAQRPQTPIKPKIKHACYSDLPRACFNAHIQLEEDFTELGLKKDRQFHFYNEYFYHSRLNDKASIGKDGGIHFVHHALASSWDRSTDSLMMARVLRNEHGSIFYGGRPDTEAKALRQAEDIFLTERKYMTNGKPMPVDDDGVIELTYVVDSLTNGGTLQNPGLLNERSSLLDEIKALNQVRGKVIEIEEIIDVNGIPTKVKRKVRLNPIHIHHMVSFWNRFSPILPDDVTGVEQEREINKTGYQQLIDIAKKRGTPERAKLIEDTIHYLQQDLPVQERLLLSDLLAKLSDLPVVHHCKSIVDRTSIGAGISTINQFIVYGDIPLDRLPVDSEGRFAPHLLSRTEEYKHLFVSTLNIQHQVSKDARTAILPNGKIEGRAQLGLNYHDDTFGTVPAALALMPKEALTTTWVHNKTYRTIAIGAAILFSPLIVLTYYLTILFITLRYQDLKFSYHLAILPFQIRWHRIGEIDASTNFDFNSRAINGDERALLVGAKTTHLNHGKDPRYQIIPSHLH